MVKFFQNLFKTPDNNIGLPDEYAGYNQARGDVDKTAICFAPSANMLFSQTGEVQVCCHNTEYFIGKYPEQSIAEIWKSKQAEGLRKLMNNYKLPKSCKVCQSDIELGAFDEVRARQFDDMAPDSVYPSQMEFLISNICNLECVMCKGEFSSLIRQNRDKLPAIKTPYDDAFVQQLKEFIPHLREARFSGSGEAFLIDLNYKIWELIIELNPACVIMIQTNGTVLNERIKDLLGRGNFQIGVSLDSVNKEVYENIRIHARFDRVVENIQYFSDYSKANNRKFSLSLCVMRQNWRELADFVNFANRYQAYVTFHKVWHPLEYSLNTLPPGELEDIEAMLNQHTLPQVTSLEKHNARHYEYFCRVIDDWRKKAELFHPEGMSTEELRKRILDRAKVFFDEHNKNGQQLALNLSDFTIKFNDLINGLDDEFDRKLLILLNYERFTKIYSGFEKLDIAELREQGRKHA